MSVRLRDIAGVIRSKNAGPYELTLDILFDDPAWYRRVVDSGLIDAHLVSRLYRVPERDVLGIIAFDPAHAVKFTLRRQRVAGDLGETDVYGAQHHAPLVDLELDL